VINATVLLGYFLKLCTLTNNKGKFQTAWARLVIGWYYLPRMEKLLSVL